MVGAAGLRGADHVHHALRGAMDCLRTRRQDGDADRVLVLLHRRRRAAAPLRALYSRPGLHPGAGVRGLCLCAQPLFRVARPARGTSGLAFRPSRYAAMAAKPRSRSAIRSSTSSRPMWRRTVGPSGAHRVAVRMLAQSKGMARLSKPPHDAPMPNKESLSRKACTALAAMGLKTMLNSPLAPEKSRCQSAWPGQLSSAG